MPSVVVSGIQWGDEGKGKLVDYLAENADVVVRFQGGNNAGHTLVVNGHKTKLQLTPCGILRPTSRCVIGAGVVANPYVLLKEIDELRALGVNITPERLILDRDAGVVLDYHPILDQAREAQLGERKIGTTGRGIGPAYEDRAARRGVRFGDLLDLAELRPRLEALVEEKNLILSHVLKSNEQVSFKDLWVGLQTCAERLVPFIGNGSLAIDSALRAGARVVFEGAQAALLDVVFGTVPYVTSSHTLAGAAAVGSGIGPRKLDYVLGVAKAYTTRVGSGPFPSELLDETGDRIRTAGGEFGTVTGRPRRCGWMDLLALRRAIRLNSADSIAITKLDVLTGINPLRVCTGYRFEGKSLEDFPSQFSELARVEPQFVEIEGWTDDLSGCSTWEALPLNVKRYVQTIEELAACPVSMISVSAERSATIFTDKGRFLKQFTQTMSSPS